MVTTKKRKEQNCPRCGSLSVSDSVQKVYDCPGCKNTFLVDENGSYTDRAEDDVVIICPRCKDAWYSDIPGLFLCSDCSLEFEVSERGIYTENIDAEDVDDNDDNKENILPMSDTFALYLEKWLKHSTSQGLNNPLVKMPVRRFRLLQQPEFASIANGGTLIIGTMSDPIARNLYKNFQTRIRERGERCAFICSGSVEMTIAGSVGQPPRTALFPIGLKRSSLQTTGDRIKVTVSDEERWQFNPVLEAHLHGFGINVPPALSENPERGIIWLKAQLGNRASQILLESYVGLFSSQQMVVQQRLTDPPLRHALARNPVVRAKIEGVTVGDVDLGEISDHGLEELGLVLPCDDSQLRVVQMSAKGSCLQVEGPPGTGKSQTIANIISTALYHGHRTLLVCDKKAAIVQVEERLTNCGLKPAIMNLHDEDLDKREFLVQAVNKFSTDIFGMRHAPDNYPFDQLRETRKALNDRVKFGREIAHPSLQVTKRQALSGLIQLRKELKNVPSLHVANWQSLSKERLNKLISSVAEWPELTYVLKEPLNVWNNVRTEMFDENPNAVNELQALTRGIFAQIESLGEVQEWTASIGIELPIQSNEDVAEVLALVETVIKRPSCHPKMVGNSDITLSELKILSELWKHREELVAARHPVPLTEIYPPDAEREAKDIVETEKVKTWESLSHRESYYTERHSELEKNNNQYMRLCDQIGLVYSPLLKVRRAQLQMVLGLGGFGGLIPRSWWVASTNPVLMVDGWVGKLRGCIGHIKASPLPLHLITLERVASTHWQHVEAMAEHGFNMVSYCLKFVNDRKCKYALRQAYPSIPVRGFKQWRDVTLHAVTAQAAAKSLREAAEAHVVLKHLTENYLAVAHEIGDEAYQFVNHADVRRLQNAAALVEQCRERNDLFEVNVIHWQTFWESPNPNIILQVESLLSEFDTPALPVQCSDNMEEALYFFERSRQRIRMFLQTYEKQDGDRSQPVLASFAAQKEYARCQDRLVSLKKYLELQDEGQLFPDWQWLHEAIAWRDLFERLRGKQKLDIDSALWPKLSDRLQNPSVPI